MSFSPIASRIWRLSGPASLCRQCLSKTRSPPSRSFSQLSSKFLRANAPRSSQIKAQLRPFSFTSKAPKPVASPLGGLADSVAQDVKPTAVKARFFPETTSNTVAYWLLGSAGLVFGIVVWGGLTRLTESGLSITEWKPVTGTLPPMSQVDWEENFAKYKDSPEYRILNPHMTLDEYKFIYYMEWGHRLWGRFIGLSFVIPAAYFVARRQVSARVATRIFGIAGLIGFQGFIGWWMVKSGLRDDLFAKPGAHPRVSQYRLTAHLGAAFAVYSAMLWSGLDILRQNRMLKNPLEAVKELKVLSDPRLRVFRIVVGLLAASVFTTAMTGGLVAGLDAGLIYNEWPWMGTGFKPPSKELMDPFYTHREDKSDMWRNHLENPTMVQFQHRTLAYCTFTAIVAAFAYSRFSPAVKKMLPRGARKGMMGVVHLAVLQVLLGITTLIYMVPTPLAASHQAGSLALLTGTIVLGSRVWVPRVTQKMVEKRVAMLTKAAGNAAAKSV